MGISKTERDGDDVEGKADVGEVGESIATEPQAGSEQDGHNERAWIGADGCGRAIPIGNISTAAALRETSSVRTMVPIMMAAGASIEPSGDMADTRPVRMGQVLLPAVRLRLATMRRSRGKILRALLAGAIAGVSVVPLPAAEAAASVPAVRLVGAGDIASCRSTGDGQTAALLDGMKGTVFTTGDNAYGSGTPSQYNNCYGPTWGRHKSRTRPTPGNHDYLTEDAAGYFGYFGDTAGTPGRGWYAYNRGAWRMYALNSNCDAIGGCWIGSAQERWLRADLAANPHDCVMAYWHHPRFSSGRHGNQLVVRGLWKTLYAAGADIVVNGHDHDYERFAPQGWSGTADPVGIREFVVGTGGRGHYPRATVQPNSEAWDETSYGVLKLVLGDGWYRWRFIAAGTSSFSDSGSTDCH